MSVVRARSIATTGYVVDLGVVRDIVEREVIEKTDHRNLNLEVDYLSGINPTSENIVVAMWRVLAPALQPARLAAAAPLGDREQLCRIRRRVNP